MKNMNKKLFYTILIAGLLFSAAIIMGAGQKKSVITNQTTIAAATNSNPTNSAATNKAVTKINKSQPTPKSFISRYFDLGGPFMYPLLLLSIAGLGIVLERFWYFSRQKLQIASFANKVSQTIKEQGIHSAIDLCKNKEEISSRIIAPGLALHKAGINRVEKAIETSGNIEVSLLERGLSILAAIANLAPLLGFLGTVTGMIAAFQAIASADTVSAKLVSVGIFEALITTAVGLIVAIPAFAFHNIFVHKIDKFSTEVEQSAASIIHSMTIKENGGE